LPVSSVFKTLVAASVDALTSVMDIFNMDTDRMGAPIRRPYGSSIFYCDDYW
jgi:hypothetical protein